MKISYCFLLNFLILALLDYILFIVLESYSPAGPDFCLMVSFFIVVSHGFDEVIKCLKELRGK